MLSKENLKTLIHKFYKVELPEGDCNVRSLTIDEARKLNEIPSDNPDIWNQHLLAYCIVDDEGKQFFDNVDEAKLLDKLSFNSYKKLVEEAWDKSGLKKKDSAIQTSNSSDSVK